MDVNTIDEYILSCDEEVRGVLNELRDFISKLVPDATEKISWRMPTYYLNENLVHFAIHKNHVGFYPSPSGIENFSHEFDKRGYKYSKGAVQFPLSDKLPYDLIEEIVKFRVKEVTTK